MVKEVWILFANDRPRAVAESAADARLAFEAQKSRIAAEAQFMRIAPAASIVGPFVVGPSATTETLQFKWGGT